MSLNFLLWYWVSPLPALSLLLALDHGSFLLVGRLRCLPILSLGSPLDNLDSPSNAYTHVHSMSSTLHTSKAADTVLGFSDTKEQMSANEEVNLPDNDWWDVWVSPCYEFRQSDSAGRILAGLRKGAKSPRNPNRENEKIDALLRTKRAREVLSAQPEDLTACWRQCQVRLRTLRSELTEAKQEGDPKEKKRKLRRVRIYLYERVIWWTPGTPAGLHFVGDCSTGLDNFPYNEENHPAVKLQVVWKTDKKKFVVRNLSEG